MPTKRRSSAQSIEHYVVAVTGWDLSWLLSIGDPKRDPEPYREHTTLTLRGDVHRPAPFRHPRAEVALSGRAVLPEPWRPAPRTLGIWRAETKPCGSMSGCRRSA